MDNYEIHEWSQTRPVVTVSSLGLRSWIEEHWPNEGDR